MEEKFKFLGQLPKEMGIETVPDLPTPDLIRLSMISKGHRTFFRLLLEQRQLLQKFIHHVARGEHEAVKAMLEKDIHLLVKRDIVTDYSGRTFESISGFEYALWALDKHMWTMMLDCLPKNEKGQQVLVQLLAQYNKVDSDGVTYRLKENKITEQHFDFEKTLIKALQTQVDSINALGAKNWDAIDKQWREGVGGAQKLLPMHVVDEYCSNEPFYPVPTFTSPPKSSRQFYNWITKKNEFLFRTDSELSVDFAIYKGWRPEASGACGYVMKIGFVALTAVNDLAAMKALAKVRTNDFVELKSYLENQMTLDNQHQVAQIQPI
ncbi:F-box protein [Legionella sp. D16C41]|uniref:F-box protein n=1 Tax=Legionella sp. D16C41 TaxID=3402688 RepID=UPI003AF9FD33